MSIQGITIEQVEKDNGLPKVINRDGTWNGDRMVDYHYETGELGDEGKYCLLVDKNGYEFEESREFDYFLASTCYYRRQR